MKSLDTIQSAQPPIRLERASDILRKHSGHPLDAMLAPKTVAVIGASETEGTVGRSLLENLKQGGFHGGIYPVNPKRENVLGLKAYPNLAAIPQQIELALIATPASTIAGIIRQCAEAQVPAAVIISAGFKEVGAAGADLERQVLAEARKGKMRVIGPNCLGLMRPHLGLNATFAASMARPGSVAFLSQSGALCTAILDWSLKENVGFSTFASLGSMLDVSWGDLIYYLGDDPHTKSIVIYMESIGDARSFLSAAREVALTKPIIVIKVGRTEAAAKAAASHTGSLTGSDDVLDAAFRRVGVLRVDTIAELFDMAEVLAKQPRPCGPRLAIITNAGGPGALATDTLIRSGGQLAELSSETTSTLNQLLPPAWSHNNPVDVLGDAGAERYSKTVEVIAKDAGNDGLLVILTPQAMTDSTGTAVELKKIANRHGKPILASWMGAAQVETGEEILNAAGIPTFKYPDRAARAFAYMWRYSDDLRSLYETPAADPASGDATSRMERGCAIIDAVRESGRSLLTEFESKKLLRAYDIPIVETHVAVTPDEAVRLAHQIGYPVVLKLHSHTITHKTDIGGVHLNLTNATAVRRAFKSIRSSASSFSTANSQPLALNFAGVTVQPMIKRDSYELIFGSSCDPQFGPVILFGAGGQLVEIFKDRALGLPPLNATLARRVMERTQIYHALKGTRGRKSADLGVLEQLLVLFSQLVIEQPAIAEIDINPLLASAEGFLALDARVLLHSGKAANTELPRPAIRPYPSHYIRNLRLSDGTSAILRPIRPEDEPLMINFHESLSEESVYYRYFTALKLPQRIAHERLARICFNDYDREIALVVERTIPRTREREILGVGRLTKSHGANDAEFALLVSDRWHNNGVGTALLKTLVEIGRNEQLDRIVGYILPGNHAMQSVSRNAGFNLNYDVEGHQWIASLALSSRCAE